MESFLLEDHQKIAASHVSLLRIIAIWGLVDIIIIQLSNDCPIKKMVIFSAIIFILIVIGFYLPDYVYYN
jgi:hypothetical protein